ncbi:PREDICTED: doublesex- and mab-3-related transcription factor B1 [Myotis brandtii]|uniref:doublesex- and mab-3-related transcription factor B1 n=1 Tax=Myotis brandtii TaxID=109478 RepID=UPI0003BBB894|nr:PREDICTED: doublesex- and mab-3-related transcription factor B1 [Myotis brandtii]
MKADAAKLATMLRTPNCSRCRNHGYLVAVKGHAGKCRWKQCNCEKCYLITERQKIMAAQKMLKKQASDEDRELASRAAALAPPPPRPPPPTPPPPFAFGLSLSINSDAMVRSEYLEREPSKLYPSCSGMYYRPFPMGYQDPSPGLGISVQQGFRHVPFSHYHGGGSMRSELCSHPPPDPSLPALGVGFHLRKKQQKHRMVVAGAPFPECAMQVPEPVENFQPSFPPRPPPPPPPSPLLPPPPPLLPPPLLPPPLSPPPPFLPPGFLTGIHFLPPPPPPPPPPPASFSLTVLSDADQETADDQVAGMPREPSQPSSQEQSD